MNCLTLNMKALWSFETWDTIHTQLTRQQTRKALSSSSSSPNYNQFHCWLSVFHASDSLTYTNMKALWSFETWDTIHTQLTRQHHIPGELYLQVLPPQIITSFIAGYQYFMLQIHWLIQMTFQQPISLNILSCYQTLTSNFFRKLHDICNLLNHCEASKIIHNLKPNFMPTWIHEGTFHQIPGHFCEKWYNLLCWIVSEMLSRHWKHHSP